MVTVDGNYYIVQGLHSTTTTLLMKKNAENTLKDTGSHCQPMTNWRQEVMAKEEFFINVIVVEEHMKSTIK